MANTYQNQSEPEPLAAIGLQLMADQYRAKRDLLAQLTPGQRFQVAQLEAIAETVSARGGKPLIERESVRVIH